MPLWNPYVFSGMPFVGDVQNGLLYPVNLALFLLRPEVTYADMQGWGSSTCGWRAGSPTPACATCPGWRLAWALPCWAAPPSCSRISS